MDLKRQFNNAKIYVNRHSPEILIGFGITGMIGSTVLAVKATPKVLTKIDIATNEKNDELTTKEKIKVVWKDYLPSVILGTISIGCIIGASNISLKRNATLGTMYAATEKALSTYREKVIETVGEEKATKIQEKANQELANHNSEENNKQIVVTLGTGSLFMDARTGRYFRSDLNKVKEAVVKLNKELMHNNYASVNYFYDEIGLKPLDEGCRLGWNVDDVYVEVSYSAIIADNNEACIVLEFDTPPKYNYDIFA